MKKVRTARLSRLILPLLILLAITGCSEEPGLVGESFVDTSQSFQFDTLYVENLDQVNFNAYTGRLQRVGVGRYIDPIFGDMKSQAMIKPSITDATDLEAVFPTADVNLRFRFETDRIWGDTLATNQYNIYRVNNLWRGTPWLATDEILFDDTTPIVSFERTNEEVVSVPMPQEWVTEYANLYNADDILKDSLFTFEFNGLVIEPVSNDGALHFINIADTELVIQNPADTAVVEIPIADWAFSLDRTNTNYPADRLVINSNNDMMIRSNFFSQFDGFDQSNIVKAELVLFRDTVSLQSSLPDGHVRTDPRFLSSHQQLDIDPIFEFSISAGDSLGRPDDRFNSFRFNLTAYVNRYLFGDGLDDDFYFTVFERTGVLRSTLIHNVTTGDPERRPIIIITRIEG